MKPAIVYHAVGPVHLRNAELVQSLLPDFEVRLAYESSPWWMKQGTLDAVRIPKFPLRDRKVPGGLFAGEVRCVIFSALQPRPTPLQLLQEARARNIPTLAIQESNQIALNGGRINNYLLPVDRILAASRYEASALRALGVPSDDVIVTGWPFGSDPAPPTRSARDEKKKRIGLAATKRVALLTLTALHDAGETPHVRRQQLRLVSRLPADHVLAVKPHPIERPETVNATVVPEAPDAVILPGNLPIHDALEAADVVLNRGASQVSIEALQRGIPVLILDTGVETPFHRTNPAQVVRDANKLAKHLEQVNGVDDVAALYRDFLREHAEFGPAEAQERVAKAIRTARVSTSRSQTAPMELALLEGWRGRPSRARTLLDGLPVTPARDALRALIDQRASRRDLEILRAEVKPQHLQPVLQALWIRLLSTGAEDVDDADAAWMRDFPPQVNGHWFARDASGWLGILLSARRASDASSFVARIKTDFRHDEALQSVARSHEDFRKGAAGRIKYHRARLQASMRRLAASLMRRT